MNKIVLILLALLSTLVGCEIDSAKKDLQKDSGGSEHVQFIGMPIGGINCGQVYLGGDGQLWYWDIFNIQRIQPGGPGDKFYLNPMVQDKQFDQGFALRVKKMRSSSITPLVRSLNKDGFSDITFTGEYPMGKVMLRDKFFPISVALNSYNDGKLNDGVQMGPFYEIESSSPALALKSGESYTHMQRVYHFQGKRNILDEIAIKILAVSIDEIEAALD
ncbi:unnamed protein product [marine sediment metagenome]|uniref:Uncharacterized protein n=1 Tax=marine sediment metagenome TaxID=412755 RepID=X1CRJ0_9ZZZZ